MFQISSGSRVGRQNPFGRVAKLLTCFAAITAIWCGSASANWTNNSLTVAPGTTATNNFFTNNAGFVASSFQTNIPANCSGTVDVNQTGSRFVQFFLGNTLLFSSTGSGSRNFNTTTPVTGLSSGGVLAGAGSVDIDIRVTCQGAPPPTTPPATTTPQTNTTPPATQTTPSTTTPPTTTTTTTPTTQGETDEERAAREERERIERETREAAEQAERDRETETIRVGQNTGSQVINATVNPEGNYRIPEQSNRLSDEDLINKFLELRKKKKNLENQKPDSSRVDAANANLKKAEREFANAASSANIFIEDNGLEIEQSSRRDENGLSRPGRFSVGSLRWSDEDQDTTPDNILIAQAATALAQEANDKLNKLKEAEKAQKNAEEGFRIDKRALANQLEEVCDELEELVDDHIDRFNQLASEGKIPGVDPDSSAQSNYAAAPSENTNVFNKVTTTSSLQKFATGQTQNQSERLTTWLNGSHANGDGGSVANGRDSSANSVAAGLAYQVQPWLTLGAAARYQQRDSNTSDRITQISTELFGGSVFSDLKLPLDFYGRLLAAYEYGDNDIISSGNRGTYGYRSLIFSGALRRPINLPGGIRLTPSAAINWSETRQDGYTNSAGAVFAARTFNVGFAKYGVSLAKTWSFASTSTVGLSLSSITGTLGANGSYFFRRPNLADPSRTGETPEEFSNLGLSGALNFSFLNGASLALNGSAHPGSAFSWTLGSQFSMPLSTVVGSGNPFSESRLSFGGAYTGLPDSRSSWSINAKLNFVLK
ncbi:MAG: autotransporter domain-containing protein [Pseudomonadota bacterium]